MQHSSNQSNHPSIPRADGHLDKPAGVLDAEDVLDIPTSRKSNIWAR